MKRIWQIEEQVVEDASTKLRIEFSSVHSDEVAAGNEAPAHDRILVLRMWSSDRARLATFYFDRNGLFIRSGVEPVEAVSEQGATSNELERDLHLKDRDPADIGPEVMGLAKPASFE